MAKRTGVLKKKAKVPVKRAAKATRAAKPVGGPKLLRLALPTPEERTLSNGLKVIAAQRGPIPLVSVRLLVRGGTTSDPEGKHGLTDFTTKLLRRGTRLLSAEQIDESVEFVGAHLSVGVGEDFLSLRLTTPSEHLEPMLDVLGQLMREPTFPEDEVESAKGRALAQLANDLDEPGLLADRALSRALWGTHPYAHDVVGSTAHVRTFTREDLVRHHRETMGPRVALLLAVGELHPERFFAAAERALGAWSGGPSAPLEAPRMERAAMHGKIIVVDKPDQTQVQVRLGSLSYHRGHPDHFPGYVMNAALGGGFTSRLVEQIRVNRGLSYGVGSGFDTLKAGGSFSINTFTKTETTRELLDVALGEVEKMRTRGMTPVELERTQTYLSGLYPLRTETNEAIGNGLGDIQMYGLPADWMTSFRERIHDVTVREANAVAKRWLFPEGQTIALVGRAEEIDRQVKDLGALEVWKPSDLE